MDKYKDLYNKALNYFGSMQIESEIVPFLEFIDKRNIKSFLEIGICDGMSFYLWSNLCEKNGIKIGIDMPNGPWGSKQRRTYTEMAVIKQRLTSYNPNTHIFFGGSQEDHVKEWFIKKIGKEKLDFLFIDGDHSYEGAKADYDFYSPYVRSGGVVALHDIKDTLEHNKNGCTVHKLWKEIRGEKLEFCDMKTDWAGIGVIIKP